MHAQFNNTIPCRKHVFNTLYDSLKQARLLQLVDSLLNAALKCSNQTTVDNMSDCPIVKQIVIERNT